MNDDERAYKIREVNERLAILINGKRKEIMNEESQQELNDEAQGIQNQNQLESAYQGAVEEIQALRNQLSETQAKIKDAVPREIVENMAEALEWYRQNADLKAEIIPGRMAQLARKLYTDWLSQQGKAKE